MKNDSRRFVSRRYCLLVRSFTIVSVLFASAAVSEVCPSSSAIDQVPFFVEQTYRDLLGRAPDPKGQSAYADQLRDFNARLCRTANPMISTGSCEWNNNAKIVLTILGTPEFASKNGPINSNGALVTALYKDLLRRTPDDAGFRYQLRAADAGQDRLTIIAGFLFSDEYRGRFACNQRSGIENVSTSAKLELGVNGHPLRATGVYSKANGVSWDDQFEQAKNLCATWYRVDIAATSTGADFADMDLLLQKAQQHGIHLLPVLIPIVDAKHDNLQTMYQKAYDGASKFVSHYKTSLHVYELSNEEDVQSIRIGPGDKTTDYDPEKYAVAAAKLHGLTDGVHAADNSALRIIDFAGWLHTGFLQRLEDDHIPYDIVGVHWYGNMGEITCPGQSFPCPSRPQHFNVIQRIQSITHGRRMWMTETNYSPEPSDSAEGNERRKEQYLAPTLARYANSPNVYHFEVVMIYELLNEPEAAGGAVQSQVGLIPVDRRPDGGFSIGASRPTYQSVQRLFRR